MRIRAEIAALEQALRAAGQRQRAEAEKRYLKSEFDFLGVGTPELRRQVTSWLRAHPGLSTGDLRRLSRELFRRRIHELKGVAILLLQDRVAELEPSDLGQLEWMLRHSYTWAYVDGLAIHVVGPLVENHAELVGAVDAWSHDGDFWIRRSALLSLLLPLRRGVGDWRRFVAYADQMLTEREFFIRKAIGWVLREVSKKQPDRVRAFVSARIDGISGVTIREAVKYLTVEDRHHLLHQYRTRKAGRKPPRGGSFRRRVTSGAAG